MIEILKVIGSAVVTALTTLLVLYLKRKWELKDRDDDYNRTVENKIDDLTERVENLQTQFNVLSRDFAKDVSDNMSKDQALQSGLREILYDRIKYLCRKFISDNKIREEDYKSLNRMWLVYHTELGGNGYLDGEMREVDKLDKY